MREKEKLIPIGIGYYKKEQWELLKSLVTDPNEIENTFEEWLAGLKNSAEKLEKAGIAPIPIEVDVLDMNSWCMQRSIPFDGPSRALYITNKFQDFIQKQEKNK